MLIFSRSLGGPYYENNKKELNQKYSYIIRGGYCEFQTLFRAAGVREVGSASGLYGWNWTAYEFETSEGVPIVVCTGYRDMTGERLIGLENTNKTPAKSGITIH